MEIRVGYFRAKAIGEYFDLRRTYKDFRYWLIGEDYMKSETIGFPERYFYLSESQKEGKTFFVWWRPKKRVGVFSGKLYKGGNVAFYKQLKINMYGHNFKDAEIMFEGKKIKVQKGSFEIIVHSMLHFSMPDWENGTSFEQGLFELFWKRIYKKQIDSFKKEALNDMYKFQAHAKKIMEMESWKTEEKTSEPHFGIGDTQFV